VKKMLDLKWSLVDERRRAAAKTRIMKEQVAKVMEEVRSNATVASKIISLAVSGEVPLRDLAMGEGLKRSTSAGRTRKKKMKGSRSASQLMGLTSESEGEQRATKSAGGEPSYTFDQANGEQPPEAGTFVTSGAAPAQDPLPYISPYELPQG
jgi:hypothetical protein